MMTWLRNITLTSLLILASLSYAAPADLMDVYKQALENDPIFKEAYSTYMASREAVPQARAPLYPQASVRASTYRVIQDTTTNTIGGLFSFQGTFDTTIWQLTTSQTIFNFKVWASLRQAHATVKAAQAVFNSAAQDLILRTARSYFDVLLANDTLVFAIAKKRANHRQYQQANQRFKVGLDAITSVYEAKAAFDQSTAEVIAGENNLENQKENLRKLTAHKYESIAPLRNQYVPLIKPEPADIDDWVNTSISQNYSYLARKYNLEAARDNIKAANAGHMPTLGVEGTALQVRNKINNSNFFAPANNGDARIGIVLSVPLFQGGLVESQVRQAQYNFQVASEQLEQSYRGVVVDTRIAYNTIINGISKVKADRQTLISQQNTVESTEAQFQVGTRTMVDVTLAQQRLFEAQRQLAQDQYAFILAILQLKFLAGTLNVDDIELVNSWLKTTRVSGFYSGDQSKSGK
ncbi:TolC family outer membrane protein [Legionella sp. W05-934-2]|uniref:TolC family outer membrane protein n=1 Tax=Legionella sp. W05-934-2 TaxID=1198649 RepID=UPI003462969D